jgi:ATP-binding cassette, subfamily B, bacterial
VLEDVSFDVCVGIVGPTGAGKTTLLGLLPRFYDPGEGAILLDQVDLRDYRLADLRRQFAIVLQEPVLFSTSISENIAYGRPGANEAQIIAAAAGRRPQVHLAASPRVPPPERTRRLRHGARGQGRPAAPTSQEGAMR